VLVSWIDRLRADHPRLAVVVDPVLRSSTGAHFVDTALLHAYKTELLPRATLITPNRSEAAVLAGLPTFSELFEVEQAAQTLLSMGCRSVVITGGDQASGHSEDYFVAPHASGWLSLPRVETSHHHGTGCVFASSAAAALALGFVEADAIALAKMATTHALRYAYAAGRGAGPVSPRPDFALESRNLPSLSLPTSHKDLAFPALVHSDLGLYAVVDSLPWVQRVIHAGVRTVQLRIKDPRHPSLRQELQGSIAAARAAGAQLFVNDHWELAIELGADGVHLGQEDLAVADLTAMARAGLRLGISTHSVWEVCRAWGIKPSYIACGPIHPTRAKAMPWIAQGNDNLAYWCHLLPLPVVAIAGMKPERALEAAQCGAAGVALISAITDAAAPEDEITRLHQAIQEGRSRPRRGSPRMPRSTLERTN
jgi:hydroxymethylpyrimidine kinase/phosphomethylpyrimidine kinase/thiamine-phosphate diphosphorylase